jgi:hypothetical protein
MHIVPLVLLQTVHHVDKSSMSQLSWPNFSFALFLWELSWPNFVGVILGVRGTKLIRGVVMAQHLFSCHGPVPYTGISGRASNDVVDGKTSIRHK